MITGIITAPRKERYIVQTLISYQRTVNGPTPYIFAEPDSDLKGLVIRTHVDSGDIECPNIAPYKCGVVKNWLRMLHWFVTQTPRASSSWILMMEDDVQWIEWRDPYQVLMEVGCTIRETGFISYWTTKNAAGRIKGWDAPKTQSWHGMLAVAIPFHAAELILDNWDIIISYSKLGGLEEPTHLDYAIGRLISEQRLKIWCHTPSLVRHLGVVSARPNVHHDILREPAI